MLFYVILLDCVCVVGWFCVVVEGGDGDGLVMFGFC